MAFVAIDYDPADYPLPDGQTLRMCEFCGIGYIDGRADASRAADEASHAGDDCSWCRETNDLHRAGWQPVRVGDHGADLLDEAGIVLRRTSVPEPARVRICGLPEVVGYAPLWALRVSGFRMVSREHRLALLRRLAADPVAQGLVTSHPDTLWKLLRAEETP